MPTLVDDFIHHYLFLMVTDAGIHCLPVSAVCTKLFLRGRILSISSSIFVDMVAGL